MEIVNGIPGQRKYRREKSGGNAKMNRPAHVPFWGAESYEKMGADPIRLTSGIGHQQDNIAGVVATGLRD